MLLAEARALARVSHANVVTVFDAGIVDDRVYLAMEFFDGGSLADWLYADPSVRPPVREVLDVFIQAGRGLAAAHAVGIVHRDFKPANVLRARDGRIKVGDFGLARALADAASLDTSAGATGDARGDVVVTSQIAGTPAYMPPEALEGRVDPRGDQFSFCVALWEALFGERPPAGISALGATATPPVVAPDRAVPRRVLAALMRGLSADPQARWPTMNALLAALEPRATTRMRQVGLGLAVTVSIGGAWMIGRSPPPCQASATELAGAWDEDVRARAAAAFERVELPYATTTWRLVETELDAYAASWEATRVAACEASVVRHERSAEAHDLAGACLQGREDALAALTAVLKDADAEVVEGAVVAAHELPPVADCSDPEALRTWGMLPPDAATRATIAAVRRGLAVIRVQLELGRPRVAAALMPPWLAHAQMLDVPHVHAEALDLHGRIAQANGEPKTARQAYGDALREAARAGDDRFVAAIWPRLVFVVGDPLASKAEAVAYELPARAALARVGDDPALVADLEHALGSTYSSADDLELADAHHERALALRREHLADDDLAIAESLNRLAGVRAQQRRADEAVALLEEVRDRYVAAVTPDHPRVGSIEFNLGQALTVAGRMDDAVVHLRNAVRIQRAALGAKNPRTVNSLAMLGTILGQTRKIDEGIVAVEEALAAVQDRPEHPQLPLILNNLGGLYHDAGRLEDSLAAHQRALDVLASRGKTDTAGYAMNLSNLALMQTALARHAEAETNFQRAIEIYERVYGPDHPDLWRPNAMLARLLRTTNRARAALSFAERAVAVLEGVTSDPNEVADAEFELAQVRWDTGRRDEETIALAERARTRWREIDLPGHAATVDEWLAKHSP